MVLPNLDEGPNATKLRLPENGLLRITELPTLLVVEERRARARVAKPSGCRQISQLLAPWLK
jgi:hypothetical protein